MAIGNYEVYVRRKGRWTLESVIGEETAARGAATRLLGSVEAVRVVRSFALPNGTLGERVILEQEAGAPGTTTLIGSGSGVPGGGLGRERTQMTVRTGGGAIGVEEVDDAPVCRTAADWFALPARLTVGRMLRGYLASTAMLPGELLHNRAALRALSKEAFFARAIALGAKVQARRAGLDAEAQEKAIREMVKAVYADQGQADGLALPSPAADGMVATVERIATLRTPDQEAVLGAPFLIGVAVCRDLAQDKTLGGRLSRLLAWVLQQPPPPGDSVLDRLVGEALAGHRVLKEMLGPQRNHAAWMLALLDLVDGTLDASTRRGGGAGLRDLDALGEALRRGLLPEAAGVILDRVRADLLDDEPLSRHDPAQEQAWFLRLRDALVGADGVRGGAEMAAALTQRAARVYGLGGRDAFAQAATEQAQALLATPEAAVGYLAAVRAAPSAAAHGGAIDRALAVLCAGSAVLGEGAANQRLARAARLHALITGTEAFPAAIRQAVGERIDQTTADFINDAQVIEKLDRPEDPLRVRALRLLKFIDSGLLIPGKARQVVRDHVIAYLRQPRFEERLVEDIADPGLKEKELRTFHAHLVKAGLVGASSGRALPAAAASAAPATATEPATLLRADFTVTVARPSAAAVKPAALAGRCANCFRPGAGAGACPACGHDPASPSGPGMYLPPGFQLEGRYFTGLLLGRGGFGATYLGWDDKLSVSIAVKEYFPHSMAARHGDGRTLQPLSAEQSESYGMGLYRFLDEARLLAKLRHVDTIVSVLDYFEANATAYMVMEYLTGKTLRDLLKEQGERIGAEELVHIIRPVLRALAACHDQGILHRDISPDNIYLTRDGRVKVLDFGAARQALADVTGSMTVMLKRGYAPLEQYSERGRFGPWTDVYAVCATLYRALTGKVPLEAVDRLDEDGLKPLSDFGVKVPRRLEEAILRGLAVRGADRFQSMTDLERALE